MILGFANRFAQHGGTEAGTTGLVQVGKIADEPPNLGRIEQGADAVGVMRLCYFGTGHGEASLDPSPGVLVAPARAFIYFQDQGYREGLTFSGPNTLAELPF